MAEGNHSCLNYIKRVLKKIKVFLQSYYLQHRFNSCPYHPLRMLGRHENFEDLILASQYTAKTKLGKTGFLMDMFYLY